MRGHTEPGRDVFGTKPAFLRQLLERLALVGGVHVLARDVLIEADFVRIVRGTMQRIGSVILISLRFTRKSWASRLPSPMVTHRINSSFSILR
jgi:hypothetical protein